MEVKYVIFCDDIRIETNGKQIIIGAYLGNAVLPTFPQPFALMAWVHFVQPETGEIPFKFLWKVGREKTQVTEIKATARIRAPADFSVFHMGQIFFNIDNPGDHLVLEFSQHDEEPNEVARLKFELPPKPTSSV